MMKTAIVSGAAGQDSSYLIEHLLAKDYFVIGIDKRRTHPEARRLINHLIGHNKLKIVDGDITDSTFIFRLIADYKPDLYINTAAMSHVGQSFAEPAQSMDVTGTAVIYVLEAIRQISPHTKFLQCSTSELWGGINCPEEGYDEDSPLDPRSPYAIAKEVAYRYVKMYREAYGLFACQAITNNHESPRRGLDFVTRKITDGIAKIDVGKQEKLVLGNIDAYRDWHHAKDATAGMLMILDHSEPDDFVLASGESYSVKDFLTKAFNIWSPNKNWQDYVEFDPRYMRPSEVPYLKGNPAKAESVLGWKREYTFDMLVEEMVKHDLELQASLL